LEQVELGQQALVAQEALVLTLQRLGILLQEVVLVVLILLDQLVERLAVAAAREKLRVDCQVPLVHKDSMVETE
jgi:hypothetical protein